MLRPNTTVKKGAFSPVSAGKGGGRKRRGGEEIVEDFVRLRSGALKLPTPYKKG